MISVILNVYKRPHMLEKQIDAILSQSVDILPENIHIWYNKSDTLQLLPQNKEIKTYQSNWNTKFFGRFTLPLLVTTPYVAIFDDDIIPQTNWFQNCLTTINNEKTNGILGGSGVILKQKSYVPLLKIGWNGTHNTSTSRVDLVGHAWFFRQEWSKYLWYETPISWDNGEDIMFSFLAQKYGGINTFVPPHPESDKSQWSTDYKIGWETGCDENASWKLKSHIQERNRIAISCINNGWKTVNKII